MNNQTTIVFNYTPDPDYHFSISLGGEYNLTYHESRLCHTVSFGSLNEMEETAKLMLTAVKVAREQGMK